MQGLMMDRPLLISSILRYAASYYGDTEIVSVNTEGGEHRYGYRALARRSAQLAHALLARGMKPGERVGTLAWNNHRHLELYYGVSGVHGVIHTLNPRLFPEQIAWIINHAEDRWLFTETTFLPLLEALADHLGGVRHIVVMTDRAHMPESSRLKQLICYEDLLEGQPETIDWPEFDEHAAAALCYTSGTTGHPKGVLYSHRSTLLHAYGAAMGDMLAAGRGDVILAVVPMFHAAGWGLPYAGPIVGAKLVLPGPKMADGETLQRLIETEGVTYAAGVPTIWMALLGYLRESGKSLGALRYAGVGGAACPPSIIREFHERHGVITAQGWGMTETSPLGSMALLSRAEHQSLSDDARVARQAMQGRAAFGVEMRIVDDGYAELPWDGAASGRLQVRGPWVCSAYFRTEHSSAHRDGWFDTGDVAIIHPDGWLQITDRSKDVIKSGGEWISSIELENHAMAHPAAAEAAVIARAHTKWTERPLLIVLPVKDQQPSIEQWREHFTGRVADWWIPDDVVYVEEMPHTATGKVNKLALRERYKDFRFSNDRQDL